MVHGLETLSRLNREEEERRAAARAADPRDVAPTWLVVNVGRGKRPYLVCQLATLTAPLGMAPFAVFLGQQYATMGEASSRVAELEALKRENTTTGRR